MKKEYHYTISRTDRICLVSFVAVLLAWELIKGLFPGGSDTYQYVEKAKTPYVDYKTDYKKKYSSNNYPRYKNSYKKFPSGTRKKEFPKPSPPDQPLSILTASVNELASMGLSAKVAFNIQKYIASGGTLHTPEDLMKIYGMDSTQLLNALPYIIFPPPPTIPKKDFSKKDYAHKAAPESVNLNTATIEELESLHGIGKVLAERIIKFRETMGGFIHPDQLKDCYGISPELFDQLKPQLQVSGSPVPIPINEADLTAITHPYLNKKMARLIKAYKDQHGPFRNEEELKKVYPADSTWFNKILPYLSFELNKVPAQ